MTNYNDRVRDEFALLKSYFSDIVYTSDDHWFLIPEYKVDCGIGWKPCPFPVSFQAPKELGQAPYGIYIPSGIKCNNKTPDRFTDPAKKQPPFDGVWALLSWSPKDNWFPNIEITKGSNLLNFAISFIERFNNRM